MTHGRKVCNTLKEIRRQIADKNEIEYSTTDCHFEGECQGTCPKCESEVKYLENELRKRTQLGKAVAVAGISLGMVGTFSACNTPQQPNTPVSAEQEIVTDTVDFVPIDTIPVFPSLVPVAYCGNVPEIITEDMLLYDGQITTKDFIREFPPPLMGVAPPIDAFGEKDTFNVFDLLEIEADKIYEINEIEIFPSFPGGDSELMKFISDNLIYPRIQASFEGVVHVRFIVEKDGTISDITVQKSPAKVLSAEAIRVIKLMPKWKPAQKDGKNVRVYFFLPIHFDIK